MSGADGAARLTDAERDKFHEWASITAGAPPHMVKLGRAVLRLLDEVAALTQDRDRVREALDLNGFDRAKTHRIKRLREHVARLKAERDQWERSAALEYAAHQETLVDAARAEAATECHDLSTVPMPEIAQRIHDREVYWCGLKRGHGGPHRWPAHDGRLAEWTTP